MHTLAFLDPGHFHETLTLRDPRGSPEGLSDDRDPRRWPVPRRVAVADADKAEKAFGSRSLSP